MEPASDAVFIYSYFDAEIIYIFSIRKQQTLVPHEQWWFLSVSNKLNTKNVLKTGHLSSNGKKFYIEASTCILVTRNLIILSLFPPALSLSFSLNNSLMLVDNSIRQWCNVCVNLCCARHNGTTVKHII